MSFTSFNTKQFDTFKQPMFLGENVNVSRYDTQKYPFFERLIEKQISFFWRPEEIDLSQDRHQYKALDVHEQHLFISNLKYQILLDSIQGRSPNIAFLPIISLPELETWVETWSFFETIHSRSYTHIIRNLVNDPSEVFDSIVANKDIQIRANAISKHYDELVYLVQKMQTSKYNTALVSKIKEKLYMTMVVVNILEAVRFYVSFACSFAFAERNLMEGNAKIIKLIARDEMLHLEGTQYILNLWEGGKEDPEMAKIAKSCKYDVIQAFKDANQSEKDWAEYLFKDGSMIGLNKEILNQYIDYITNQRINGLGFDNITEQKKNPIPWINTWLNSDNVQVAPQETEISSYLVGAINSEVSKEDFDGFTL